MDKMRELYKAGPKTSITLSSRIKDNKNRRQKARFDTFGANREILIDDSPGSPVRQPAQAISKIANRNQKLKAFRLQRNTQKLKEIQEKRSPFIVTVPSGRWVEKKERAPQFRFGLSDTPVRNVLMNERVLKKSTVKKLIAESALKKENVMDFHGKEAPKHAAVKSKKKILGELNAVQTIQVYEESESEVMLERIDSDLNSTFDISPDQNEKKDTGTKINLKKNLKRRSSMSSIASITNVVKSKMLTPPAKPVTKKYHIPAKPVGKAVIAKPVVVRKAIVVPVKASLPVSAFANGRTHLKRSAKKPANKLDSKSSKARSKDEVVEVEQENIREPVIEAKAGLRPAKQKQPARSATYNLYKSSLDIQIAYLNMKITEIMSKNNEMFLDVLSEDQQTFVHQTVQQANLLISDKLGKFQEFLDIFETGQSNDPKKVTEDDVENYFLLIYEEIEKIKNDLSKTSAMQKEALTVVASQKKRRTRKTYLQEEGTPRRSIRIAEHSNTPKHSASCYGCVTMSASKMNTSKSIQKRRTTIKKSVLFDNVEATPNRRSTKIHVPTPKRSLIRMNAVDVDNDLELDDIL